mmetsp:Transcript_28745/g.66331  ORF Transcript_28745/g.66331 Transcript_28745/m.66331 type:complete len:247 (-) Transcript_28745:117-857(-)
MQNTTDEFRKVQSDGPKIEEWSSDSEEDPVKATPNGAGASEEGAATKSEVDDLADTVSGIKIADLSAEALEEALAKALERKNEGNRLYGLQDYDKALECYTEAIEACPVDHKDRSVYFNNRAACYFTQGLYKECIPDCTAALKLDEDYLKPLLRRAQAHEALKDYPPAFDDFTAVVKKDPSNAVALGGCRRLEGPVTEQREREKEEMMGKLKEVGNQFLGLFGMSVDNFAAVKDPVTGNYSISMKR